MKTLLLRFRKNRPEDAARHEEPAAPKPPREGGGLSVRRIGLVLFLASVAVVAAAAVAAYLEFGAAMSEKQAAAADASGKAIAGRVAGRLHSLGEVAGRLAADSGLESAVLQGDEEALQRKLDAVRTAFEGAMAVRIIDPTQAEPDESVSPAVGYACLDLARIARQGASVPVEMHQVGSDDQHIDIVRPVGSGEAVAALSVALAPGRMKAWLADAIPKGVFAEVRQSAAGRSVTLAAAGSAGAKRGEARETPIPGTGWSLAYWLPAAEPIPEARRVAFFSVFGAAGAMMALIILGGIALLSRLLNSDLARLAHHMVELFSGARHHSLTMRLLEVQRTVRAIDEALPSMPQKRVTPRPVEQDSSYTVTEEPLPPDPLFMDKDAFSVDEVEGDGDEAKRR